MKILFGRGFDQNLVKALELLLSGSGFHFLHELTAENGRYVNIDTRFIIDEAFKDGYHFYVSDIELLNKNLPLIKALKHRFVKIIVFDDKFHGRHRAQQILPIIFKAHPVIRGDGGCRRGCVEVTHG
jgi:hypothetical protein